MSEETKPVEAVAAAAEPVQSEKLEEPATAIPNEEEKSSPAKSDGGEKKELSLLEMEKARQE